MKFTGKCILRVSWLMLAERKMAQVWNILGLRIWKCAPGLWCLPLGLSESNWQHDWQGAELYQLFLWCMSFPTIFSVRIGSMRYSYMYGSLTSSRWKKVMIGLFSRPNMLASCLWISRIPRGLCYIYFCLQVVGLRTNVRGLAIVHYLNSSGWKASDLIDLIALIYFTKTSNFYTQIHFSQIPSVNTFFTNVFSV